MLLLSKQTRATEMKLKRKCLNCEALFFPNCNPNQAYCNHKPCQAIRKNQWRKNKLRQDKDYQLNQANASRRWRKKHPEYWRCYRASHPLYTLQNRIRTLERKRMAKTPSLLKSSSGVFANSDALISSFPIQSGTYELKAQFANSDALLVEIKLLSTSYEQHTVCK